MEHGTSEGRYLFEMDGVTAIRATEVTGVSKMHEEFELYESNKGNPHLGRGHFKCEKIKVKHGHALNETGVEVGTWLSDFVDGTNLERRNARLIVLDEDGRSPVTTYTLRRCIPISFAPDTQTAGGKNANYFNFEIRPEDMEIE
ncbi:MAG: phage tail protein [Blastocatellia bacterium]